MKLSRVFFQALLFAISCEVATAIEPVSAGTGGDFLQNLDSAPIEVHRDPAALSSVFDVVINPGPNLAADPLALSAFNRAAATWESLFSDPITVTIDAEIEPFASTTTIGSASSVLLVESYDLARDMMIADAVGNATVAALPTAANIGFSVPDGFTFSGDVLFTKANVKALGYADIDDMFGVTDATISFNSNFSFDYDNSDGVGSGQIDFESVALHEIGHALGFISEVDEIDELVDDGLGGEFHVSTVDLFRFADGGPDDPSTLAEFTSMPRNLEPGTAAIFDDLEVEGALSTGVNTGDGRQAGHWKDNNLTGILLDPLDPTLEFGQVFEVSELDLRTFDVIGYDLMVPEPTTVWLALLGLAGVWRRRR